MVATYGAVHVDELSEALWPGSPPGAGRARLRNVLSRLRADCGELIIRVGETVAVADDVEVDVAVFEAIARRALALPAADPRRQVLGIQALGVAQGELLPEDIYRDWAVGPRERIRHYRLAVLDALAEGATATGDVSTAVRRWQEAIELEPYDEMRYAAAAALLMESGRWGAAHAVLLRAESALTQLGLTGSPQLLDLRRRLSGGARTG
jgi:DNA-binding SARP family transcriptional activator